MTNTVDSREIPDITGRADAAFANELGRMVRLGRAKRGMSRRQLAQESATSERYLAQIESGAGNPSVLVMRAISDALEIPLFELLPQTGGENTTDNVPNYVANPASAPKRDTWYAEPAKVFDNLYSEKCWPKSSVCRSSS